MAHKILVVEDSPTQAERLCILLESEGYEVTLARNGREGLQNIQASPPDLIISDVVMPEMDGYTLCQAVKAATATRRLPFVLLTDRRTPADILFGLERGADNFIIKPFDDDYLLDRVRRIVEHLELRRQRGFDIEIAVRVGEREIPISADKQQIIELLLTTFGELQIAHEQVEQRNTELRHLTLALEERVLQRTEEWRQTNTQLQRELEERKRAEQALHHKDEELRLLSQQLWQAAKLATMGELAASIAHELNNPLATVSLRAESLLAQLLETDPKRRSLEVIGQEVERMGNLVAHLLQFSRRGSSQMVPLDVCAEIDNTMDLIHYHLRNHRITAIRAYAPRVPLLTADQQQLRQVFLNLLTNASDAMPQGGTLTIRVTEGTLETGAAAVVIEFADTGVGIAPEHLRQVMEPFFTTKPEGKGTGLGLAICRRIIVQEHGGTLTLGSEVGKGTTIRITLPIVPTTTEPA